MSDWLAAATQLGALEIPAIAMEPEVAGGPDAPAETLDHFRLAWEASEERFSKPGAKADQELALRLKALQVLRELKPAGWEEELRDRLLLPAVAIGWGWASIAGAEEVDPPMTCEEAEGMQFDVALRVLSPATAENKLMVKLALKELLDGSSALRPLMLGWLDESIFSAIPLPDPRDLLWRFLVAKTPQKVAFEVGELLEARRSAHSSQPLESGQGSAVGEFELDVELSADGQPVTALTPWRAGSVQELISQQLWQSWFESRLWLRHHARAERDPSVQLPVPSLPDWRLFGVTEAEKDSAPSQASNVHAPKADFIDDFQRQIWDVFAEGRAIWLESAADGYGEEMPVFRQRFMAPVTTELLASALRICELQLRCVRENDSFLLLHGWMALQLARLDGLRPDELDWARVPTEVPAEEAFGSLVSHEAFPLLPSHRQQDWRVVEVFRPLLFGICSELKGATSLVEEVSSASRIWHPGIAELTLRGVLIDCVTQGKRRFRLGECANAWLEHQPFDLAEFSRVVEDINRGQLEIQLGALGGLMETFKIPSAGHRIPAWLGKRFQMMREGVF